MSRKQDSKSRRCEVVIKRKKSAARYFLVRKIQLIRILLGVSVQGGHFKNITE